MAIFFYHFILALAILCRLWDTQLHTNASFSSISVSSIYYSPASLLIPQGVGSFRGLILLEFILIPLSYCSSGCEQQKHKFQLFRDSVSGFHFWSCYLILFPPRTFYTSFIDNATDNIITLTVQFYKVPIQDVTIPNDHILKTRCSLRFIPMEKGY